MTEPTESGERTALLETPNDPAFMALLSRRSPTIQDGFDYWCSKGWPDRLPRREDIEPMEMATLLPNVVLLDVQQNPLDFYYRLVGTGVVHHLARDLTGSRMSQLEHQKPPSRIWESCEKVVETACPYLTSIPYVGPHAHFLYGEDIVLPLGDQNGAVSKLLVFIAYIPKSVATA